MAEKSSNTCLIAGLIGFIVLIMCCCCSGVGLIIAGSAGTLPDDLQYQYDDSDWYWDEYVDDWSDYDSTTDTDTYDTEDSDVTEDCTFPNGDIEYWWYDADEATKDCYRDMYGEPYFLSE